MDVILRLCNNSKQIIQILQPKVTDNFSKHSYIVDISYYFFIFHDLTVTFENIFSCFEDFW